MNNKYFIYDKKTNKVLGTELSAKEVENIIGLKNNHVYTYVKDKLTYKKQYLIFFDTGIFPSELIKTGFVDTAHLANEITLLVQNLKKNILHAYKKCLIENNKLSRHDLYYLLDTQGLPILIFDNYEKLAVSTNLPIGTVKSRIHRINNLTYKGNPIFCSKSKYEDVYAHYFKVS
jgi:hypothetical protein